MRHSDLRIVIGKVALPIVLLVIAGIAIGSYVVFRGEGGKSSQQAVIATADPRPAMPEPIAPVAPPTAPMPAPEAVPVANPDPSGSSANQGGAEPSATVETAATAPVLVEVRIDSTPNGATVTLVDRGKSQFVGTTPVNATLDVSREYDLMFTFPNKAKQLEHLNARTTRRVAVTLGDIASAAKPADAAPRHVEQANAERAPATSVRKPSAEAAPATSVRKPSAESTPASPARKTARAAAEPAPGEGTLMVSSKPPCEIVIDGKPIGLTTPQRSITLSAGNHKITLVNSEKDIKKTVSVQITANTTEKVIEDLMQ